MHLPTTVNVMEWWMVLTPGTSIVHVQLPPFLSETWLSVKLTDDGSVCTVMLRPEVTVCPEVSLQVMIAAGLLTKPVPHSRVTLVPTAPMAVSGPLTISGPSI